MFVTAYDEYAIAAFEEGAVDYLLKPVTPERIEKVVARLKARLARAAARPRRRCSPGSRRASPAAASSSGSARRSAASMRMLPVDDVLYFQSEDKYTKVVTADTEALIRKPIKELYDELDPDAFWQIHRSTIVSLRAIAKVERDWRDQPVITLKGRPEQLTVSRTFAHRFKAM